MERPKRGASRADAAKAAVAAAAGGVVAGKKRVETYEVTREAAVYDEARSRRPAAQAGSRAGPAPPPGAPLAPPVRLSWV